MFREKHCVLLFIQVLKDTTAGQDYIWKELEEAVKEFEYQNL